MAIENRLAKRQKRNKRFTLENGSHPYGIQPLGNLYLNPKFSNFRNSGLGAFSVLSDELILELFSSLSTTELCRLALVSKAIYVFINHDELWRTRVLEDYGGDFSFETSWRVTYQKKKSTISHIPLKVEGIYSDYLFQSWLCASLKMKPEWIARDNIPRRRNLSLDTFVREFEEPNRPVIITDVMADWPALKKWNRDYLLECTGEAKFTAGPVDMSLEKYFQYCDSVTEERPLYVFDPHFANKASALEKDYDVPKYFQEDLFSLLGRDRPEFRWLIIGPARSGSSWHIDPNATSAWNAVVRGAKKWILFPPDEVPPGVLPSADGADVATSVSLVEWFMNFYEQAVSGERPRPVEGVCRAGEVLFVPRGWWHLVVNLEDSVALTHNFVTRRNLLEVLQFLQKPNAQALVSGTRDRESLHVKFRERFEASFPGELDAMKAAQEEAEKQKSRYWDSVADVSTGGFKFGF